MGAMPGMKLLSRPQVAPLKLGELWEPAPLYPPLWWLDDATADVAPPKLTFYPGGRVAGVVAAAGVCTLNEVTPGECWTVPRPRDGRGSTLFCPLDSGELDEEYRKAHPGVTDCVDDNGDLVTVVSGNLAGAGGHASATGSILAAQVHYNEASDDTRYMVARGRYVWSDRAGGVVFVGAAWPEVTERQAAEVRAAACSIDYRLIRGQGINDYRLIGSCLVNIGAIPSRFAALLDEGPVTVTAADVARLYASEPAARAAALSAFGFEEDDMPQPARIVSTNAANGYATGGYVQTTTTGYVNPGSGDINVVPPPGQPCTDCGGAPRTAAYVLVNTGGAEFGRQITWTGGLGMFVNTVSLADGSPGYIVFPEVNGSIDDDNPVVVSAADASVTDSRYDYVCGEGLTDDLVITASTSLGTRLTAGHGNPATAASPDALIARLEERFFGPLADYIAAERQAEVQAALAELAPLADGSAASPKA